MDQARDTRQGADRPHGPAGRARAGTALRRGALLVALLLAGFGPAHAQAVVAIRSASHDDYGRLVFDWPEQVGYEVRQEGDRIVVRFDRPARFRLRAASRAPRNVREVTEAGDSIVIETLPGTRMRHFRTGTRVVMDFRDATPASRRAAEERAGRPDPAAGPPSAAPPIGRAEMLTREEVERMPEEERLRQGFFAVMAALDPNPPNGPRMFRYFLARNLQQLGYGAQAARPMPDAEFSEAVAAYQRQIGAPPTGRLTLGEGERLLRMPNLLTETRISAGPRSVTFADDQASATGTWIGQERAYEHPVNQSQITCIRRDGRCYEASSRVGLADNDATGVLLTGFVVYRVREWSREGLRAEAEWPCTMGTLMIRPAPGDVTLTRRPKRTAECAGSADAADGTVLLGDGFDATWQYYQQRRAEALGAVSPGLRAQMEGLLSATRGGAGGIAAPR